jgi:hypothetical protein
MFNDREFEKLRNDLDFYARDYAKAEAGLRAVKEEAIEKVRGADVAGPEVVEILNEMSRIIDDLDLDKRISKEYFYKTKDKMLAMLENIVLPESYF